MWPAPPQLVRQSPLTGGDDGADVAGVSTSVPRPAHIAKAS